MKREVETKFYEFSQNNSGGHFDVNEKVCHRVIIEAIDSKHAISIFEPMIENQSSSCPCCGDRWSTYDPDAIDLLKYKKEGYPIGIYEHYKDAEQRWFKLYGNLPRLEEPKWKQTYSSKEFTGRVYFETIEQYVQYLANDYGWTTPDARIYFLDGTKKEIFKSESK